MNDDRCGITIRIAQRAFVGLVHINRYHHSSDVIDTMMQRNREMNCTAYGTW